MSTDDKSGVQAKSPPDFPIVGIGASAGGLEAFVELLKHLDLKTGMAFVLVQHLDPNHESLLTEILARATTMPVLEAQDHQRVEPNHVYVIPPNVVMTLDSGSLRLSPRDLTTRDVPKPIDVFFYSLALERMANAIGVILSGTGTDGAEGLAAIIAEGGVTFAQERTSAKFDAMPAAAIASGVDFVLAPSGIASELANIAKTLRLPRSVTRTDNRVLLEKEPDDLRKILALLRTAKGLDFSHYKTPTIERRTLRRMAMHNLSNAGDYVEQLKTHPAELDLLFEDILVKVTSFFRVPESFSALREHVFPALLKDRPQSAPVRIWVPGCATGEEAYSIAICFLEFMDEIASTTKIELFATDISEIALGKARFGLYADGIAEHVSPERLSRFFVKEGTGYRVTTRVRECCIFAKQNVAHDPPFSRLDLISCRNLLIYLAPDIQKRVMTAFHFALRAGGFLALGSAETIGAATDLFGVTDRNNKIYSKRPAVIGSAAPDFVIDRLGRRIDSEIPSQAGTRRDPAKRLDVKDHADRIILAKFGPPGVVINERMDVLQVRGDTSPYLTIPPGEATLNLLKMCRPGLLVDLRSGLHEAALHDEPLQRDSWITPSGQPSVAVTIHVLPFTDPSTAQRLCIVLFNARAVPERATEELTGEGANDLRRVERELSETKDYLNAIIEKEQATNEELKSASEEILSANEELQSTNEEMATAKEETQASNEELTTVNDELQTRNQEMARVSSDLANLFGSVQIPIVMLSETLAIRRLTPSAEKVLNLSAADLGRRLGDLAEKLRVDGLPALAAEVIESLNTKDQEVQDRDGRWYSLRIKPYRTGDNKIDGAVIALVDIDSLKRSFAQLKEAYDYADAIVQTAPVPLLVLDAQLRVISANEAFYRQFQVKEIDTKNVRIYDMGNGQWKSPRLRELLEEILPKDELMENFVVEHEFPHIGRRFMRISARRLLQQSDKASRILLAISDLTEERRTEESLNAAKEAAETANRAKSDFLANMSHEIRTPLGAILGYSELLANPEPNKTETLNSVTRIRRNVEHLTELIDEILDIAKIEAGKLDVERVRFALLPEMAETFALLQSRAEDKGLTLDVTTSSDIPEAITSCPRRLWQILLNIVGNALKFTEKGGVTTAIKYVPTADGKETAKLYMAVTDTGCGLTLEQQGRLFQPFSQADTTVTRRFGGTGLGLTLARRLAELLGGDVVLTESEAGKGSTFTVSLDPGALDGVPMLKGLTKTDLDKRTEPVTDWFTGNDRLAGLRILLVEDGPDNQILMEHFLVASGAKVDVASNGLEGTEMAKAAAYDVVLMDIQMPVLDGYEATKRLRAAGFEVPIVALTAPSMRGERERCIAAGCVDYVSKPVKPGVLVGIVEKAAKNSRGPGGGQNDRNRR